ncbi:hypothetical protein RhiJN_21055 [Ceratobasidium sp. AG-Ba]|nr:hypothetical protein RhiJN_21055 [Ceratobasidium sp. AG-Ba]
MWGDTIELLGPYLIGLFVMDWQYTRAAMVVWNWKTGKETLRHVIPTTRDIHHYRRRVVDFLSEDVFVICRPGSTGVDNKDASVTPLGFLDIYQFDPRSTDSPPAKLINTLILPPRQFRKTHHEDLYFSSSFLTFPDLRAQVWEQSLEDRLVCVTSDRSLDSENVCVSAGVLLDYARVVRDGPVLWDEWGARAVWDRPDGLLARCDNKIRTYGSHLAAMAFYNGGGVEVQVYKLEHVDSRPKLDLKSKLRIGPDPSVVNDLPGDIVENDSAVLGDRILINLDDENCKILYLFCYSTT